MARIVYIDKVWEEYASSGRYGMIIDSLLELGDVSFRDMLNNESVESVCDLHRRGGVDCVVSHLSVAECNSKGEELTGLEKYTPAYDMLKTIAKNTRAPVVVYTGASKEWAIKHRLESDVQVDSIIYKKRDVVEDEKSICSSIRSAWDRYAALPPPGEFVLCEDAGCLFVEGDIRWHHQIYIFFVHALWVLMSKTPGGVIESIEEGCVEGSVVSSEDITLIDFYSELAEIFPHKNYPRLRFKSPSGAGVQDRMMEFHRIINAHYSWDFSENDKSYLF